MKVRLARKICGRTSYSLIPSSKDYWALKISNTQFYEGAVFDHRVTKAMKLTFNEKKKGHGHHIKNKIK